MNICSVLWNQIFCDGTMSFVHDQLDLKNLCRICLSEGNNNISFENALQRKRKDSPSILWALEKVMSIKISFNESYPDGICPNCLGLLSISYDLRIQFENSQKVLKEHFAKCWEDMDENDNKNWGNAAFSEASNSESPNLESDVEEAVYIENDEHIEYIYEEKKDDLDNYSKSQNKQERAEKSEGESVIIHDDSIDESNEWMDDVKSVQINVTSPKKRKELQVKQLDIDKYIIETPGTVDSAAVSLTYDRDDKNLSSLDEELLQAAYNLKYECPGCPKVYSSLRNLSKHKETCVKLKRLTNASQPATFNIKSEDEHLLEDDYFLSYDCDDELEQHKVSEHSESKLNIFEEFKLEDLSQMDQELFKGALLLKYECDTCPKVYSSSDKLEKHKITCEKLKKKYVNKSKIDRKITPNQSDSVALSSEQYKSDDVTKEIHLNNLSQFESDIFHNVHGNYYKCQNCLKFYSTMDRFKRHLMYCEPKNAYVYSCEICGHVSSSKNKDLYHKKTAHEEKKYACEKCGKLFAVKCVLKQHMQSHAKDKTKVVCPICGKGFHYSSGLFYHMKMHKKELNYLCDYCERRFINLNALKRHLATHTGERRYHCRICDKKFKGSAELRMHELRHTGNKPHRCEYCDKGYTSKSNLQVHIITHKGNVPCDRCDRKFLNADVLLLHRKIKHKIHRQNPFLSSSEEVNDDSMF